MATFSFHGRDGRVLQDAVAAAKPPTGLAALGIEWGRWSLAEKPVSSLPHLTYARELNALQRRYGAQRTDRVHWRHGQTRADVARTWPEPGDEHVHEAREVRVVLQGQVGFVVRAASLGIVASVTCEAGDWIALPAGLAHACRPLSAQVVEMLRLFDERGASVARRTASPPPWAWSAHTMQPAGAARRLAA